MYQLDKHESVITHVKFRLENHGKEKKLAADVNVTTTGSNELLDRFEPGLAKAFFRKAAKGKGQDLGEQQSLIAGADGLVALKSHVIASLPIQFEREGYELQIEPLNDGEDPLFHVDVKVSNVSADLIDGGSVSIYQRYSFPCEAADASDLLRAWARGNVTLTATPPAKQTEDEPRDPDTDPDHRNP